MDEKVRLALKEMCRGEKAAALVTIIRVYGSAPRKAGTKMLVNETGQTFGTIGGGCGEAEVRREALHALDSLRPARYKVNMTQEAAAEEGMACGGVMEVLIDIIPPGTNEEKEFWRNYTEALEKDEKPLLLTAMDSAAPPAVAGKLFTTPSGRESGVFQKSGIGGELGLWLKNRPPATVPILVRHHQLELFVEPAPVPVELIILGGGHIGLPLCNIAKVLGYHVTVIDDRPFFANRERFGCADTVICEDFLRAIENLDLSRDSYLVIVTRGHRHDKLCLRALIGRPVAYIGMIGSKRRVKALLSEMVGEGYAPEAVAKIHSPVGLDIGAQTPEEIAVSILAEVISVHRHGAGKRSAEDGEHGCAK